MDELVKRIDPHFAYEWHEIEDGIMRVYVRSTRKDAQCPYCGSISKQVHSVYPRKFRDLPIQRMKVEIVIRNRKFYCQIQEIVAKFSRKKGRNLPFDSIKKQVSIVVLSLRNHYYWNSLRRKVF